MKGNIKFPLGFPWEGFASLDTRVPRPRLFLSFLENLFSVIMSAEFEDDAETTNQDNTELIRRKEIQKTGREVMADLKQSDVNNEPIEWIDEGSEEEDARVELGLVGQIWTERHINPNAFITTMKNVWQPKFDVEIKNMGKNLYVFQFHHWRDKKKVVEGQPWHFDRHVILMDEVKGNCKPSDLQLQYFPIWARVYNLPFKGRMNIANVKAIADKIGTFVKLDNSGAVGIDKSIRIRILHDVHKPLAKSVKVKMKHGGKIHSK